MPDIIHKGGCHCGRVEFEVSAPADIQATQCKWSICSMTGFLHLIVKREAFRLIRGQDDIATYTFNTGVAQHHFCRHCGVKSWYVPRSHPDGVSVNVNCLRPDTIASVTVESFDGRNWEQNISQLSPISD